MKLNITKERKYILVGGGILLILALFYRFYPMFQDLGPAASEINLKVKKIAKYRRKALARDELESRRITLNRNLERAEFGLLAGETPALAAVDIQNAINEITNKMDVEIKTMQVLKSVGLEKMNYLSIPVQFTFSSSLRQLKDLLYQIESSQKYLTIDSMKIRNVDSRQTDQLQSTITVSGFLKKKNG